LQAKEGPAVGILNRRRTLEATAASTGGTLSLIEAHDWCRSQRHHGMSTTAMMTNESG
jgi:hypothetical protein